MKDRKKKIDLKVEELEERIAPGLIGVNPPGQLPKHGAPPPPGQRGN